MHRAIWANTFRYYNLIEGILVHETEKKDAIAYIQDIMRITKGLKWNSEDGLMIAFYCFEPGQKRDLDPPNTGLTEFIKRMK